MYLKPLVSFGKIYLLIKSKFKLSLFVCVKRLAVEQMLFPTNMRELFKLNEIFRKLF